MPLPLFALMVSNHFVYAIGLKNSTGRYIRMENMLDGGSNIRQCESFRNSILLSFHRFQIESVSFSAITSGIEVDGEYFVICCNGIFAKFTFRDKDKFSLVPLFKSKYNSRYFGKHFLFNH